MLSLSCKKNDKESDLAFSTTCDFAGSNTRLVEGGTGTLRYTGLTSNTSLPDDKFVIESPGQLPMVVCNMPSTFELTADQTVRVTYSGRLLVLAAETDASNTEIELNYLKFEEEMSLVK